ncbi:MAG: PQQ-dependent sugar dehydrogenase [Pyrinomonadaceae bacterium]
MSQINRVKLFVLCLFLAGCGAFLFTNNFINRPVAARSAGPDAGFTGAPGEDPEACAACHLPQGTSSGAFTITAPQTYLPGQIYQITVRHTTSDQTRLRWGFELTALDDGNERAGDLQPSTDGRTQLRTNEGQHPDRQYVEHTASGTFAGQHDGASWSFTWIAPTQNIGPVTFYAAGNQANWDSDNTGDFIYKNFVTAVPATDYLLTVSPTARVVAPGGSTMYTLLVTPSGGFTGQVTLSLGVLPTGVSATIMPSVLNLTDASTQAATLTINTTTAAQLGQITLIPSASSGVLSRSAQATLTIASPASADLEVTNSDSPDPITTGTNLTYRLVVTNNGPAAATNVSLTDTLPANVNFVSTTPSQGSCSGTTTINCALGSLAVNASATVNLVVQPQVAGTLSDTASVNGTESDPVSGNNSATTTTTVQALASGPTLTDPNLAVRTVVAGLNQPIMMAFIGNDDFLVLEKATGKVQRVTNGAVTSTVLDLAVNSNSERGLLGIALHPQFPANPRVYLYWTESSTGADSVLVDDVPTSPPLGNRVDSYLWNGSTLTFERNLIKLRAYQADEVTHRANHNGGVIRFGPDGKLYIMIGDNGRRGMLQNLQFGPTQSPTGPTVPDDQFGGPEPDDAHLTGVILRLNDDGTTPSDNPFFNAQTSLTGQAAVNVKKVFAYGVRNGFGLAFDPLTGQLWNQENGDDAFDEMNRVTAGSNDGWIQMMGPSSRIAEFKSIEVSRGDSLQQARWPPHLLADTPAAALARLFLLPGAHYTEPELSWKYAVAPAGMGFVKGRALGAQYEGDLFVGASRTTLLNGYLFRLKFASDRRSFSFTDTRLNDKVADNADKFDLAESESLLIGHDFGVGTDIETGPNGDLYVVSLSNGAVYEISAAQASTVQFSAASYTTGESGNGLGHAVVTVTRTGDTTTAASVDYATVDDPAAVPCSDTTTKPGVAFARCDYATTVDTLNFAAGETTKTFNIPLIDDAFVEGNETLTLRLSNPSNAALGAQTTATLTIMDNDTTAGANPIFSSPFFVRQQYLDFLSREPDTGGFNAWLNVLNNCADVNNLDPNSPSAQCDRILVSSSFFGSQEFRIKGYFVFLFYKVAFARLPKYAEIIPDMRAVTGTTAQAVFAKKAAFTDAFAGRLEFRHLYDDLSNTAYVDALLGRYQLTAITTTDPANFDGTMMVTLTRADLINALNTQALTRAQVLRALVQSREVDVNEFNGAFVAMQYYGYLRRTPETAGYNAWLAYLNTHPTDFRTMVHGFMDSQEYRLRFGAQTDAPEAYFTFDVTPYPQTFTFKLSDPAKIAQALL